MTKRWRKEEALVGYDGNGARGGWKRVVILPEETGYAVFEDTGSYRTLKAARLAANQMLDEYKPDPKPDRKNDSQSELRRSK